MFTGVFLFLNLCPVFNSIFIRLNSHTAISILLSRNCQVKSSQTVILSLTSICRDIRIIKYKQFALFLLANILQIDKIILLLFNQKF